MDKIISAVGYGLGIAVILLVILPFHLILRVQRFFSDRSRRPQAN